MNYKKGVLFLAVAAFSVSYAAGEASHEERSVALSIHPWLAERLGYPVGDQQAANERLEFKITPGEARSLAWRVPMVGAKYLAESIYNYLPDRYTIARGSVGAALGGGIGAGIGYGLGNYLGLDPYELARSGAGAMGTFGGIVGGGIGFRNNEVIRKSKIHQKNISDIIIKLDEVPSLLEDQSLLNLLLNEYQELLDSTPFGLRAGFARFISQPVRGDMLHSKDPKQRNDALIGIFKALENAAQETMNNQAYLQEARDAVKKITGVQIDSL